MSEHWRFGTIIKHREMGNNIAMVITDSGNGFKAISLAGEWADKGLSGGFYGYGKVWNWSIPRDGWRVISDPRDPT